MTRRELTARRALDRLGIDRFLAFVRAIPGENRPLAVALMLEHIDAGGGAESAFFDGDEYGFQLSTKAQGKNRFKVSFGCIPGPDVGEVSDWMVVFKDDHTVKSVVRGISLII